MQGSPDFVQANATARERWQLRVLNGPDCGKAFALESRLSIGRAQGSDLQLTAQEVSRHHARIVEDERGRHVIMDLGSSNGTYVDGELVWHHVLQPHSEITIADVELAYEPMPLAAAAPAVPRDEGLPGAADQPLVAARSHAPTTPVGMAVPDGALRDRNGCAVVFEHAAGGSYRGNLFADMLEYRALRAQQLRGGFADPAQAQALERLKAWLLQPAPADVQHAPGMFSRFVCWLPGQLRVSSGQEWPCHLRDVGVDGAQLVIPAQEIAIDTTVCLTVELIEAGQRRVMALAGRVAWIDGDYLGITFAGAPRREDGRYAQRLTPAAAPSLGSEDDTSPLHVARVRPPAPSRR